MKKLTRSRIDRIFAGVCSGIAEYLDISSTLVRVLYILAIALTPVTLGAAFWVYVVLALVIPNSPNTSSYYRYTRYHDQTQRSRERKDVTPK